MHPLQRTTKKCKNPIQHLKTIIIIQISLTKCHSMCYDKPHELNAADPPASSSDGYNLYWPDFRLGQCNEHTIVGLRLIVPLQL